MPVRRLSIAAGAIGSAVLVAYAGQAAQYRRNAGRPFDLPHPAAPGSAVFTRWVEAACGGVPRSGNHVTVLRNGDQIIVGMLDAIAAAQESIAFGNYIFWKGETSAAFVAAFCERARAGVEVNVLLDAYGSAKIDHRVIPEMERSGVRFSWFRAPHWYKAHQFNYRMHRRVLVVDGRVAFSGGFGVADEWTGDAEGPQHWRDTHLRIDGPAARDVLGAFMENWSEATHRSLSPSHLPAIDEIPGGAPIQVIRSSPGHGQAKAEALFLAATLGARQRLWITTAYFAPRADVVEAVAGAARRGVDVRLLLNGPHIDKGLVRQAGRRSYATLLEAGVRIFEYQQTMMHAKVILVDERWSNVGTSNWDNRSLALQEELNCSVTDDAVAATLEKHFLDDLGASVEIFADSWHRRPHSDRAYEWTAGAMRHSL